MQPEFHLPPRLLEDFLQIQRRLQRAEAHLNALEAEAFPQEMNPLAREEKIKGCQQQLAEALQVENPQSLWWQNPNQAVEAFHALLQEVNPRYTCTQEGLDLLIRLNKDCTHSFDEEMFLGDEPLVDGITLTNCVHAGIVVRFNEDVSPLVELKFPAWKQAWHKNQGAVLQKLLSEWCWRICVRLELKYKAFQAPTLSALKRSNFFSFLNTAAWFWFGCCLPTHGRWLFFMGFLEWYRGIENRNYRVPFIWSLLSFMAYQQSWELFLKMLMGWWSFGTARMLLRQLWANIHQQPGKKQGKIKSLDQQIIQQDVSPILAVLYHEKSKRVQDAEDVADQKFAKEALDGLKPYPPLR